MKTPLGWVRANLVYDKEPRPKPGTLVEVVFMLVFFARQKQEFQKTRLATQSAIEREGAEETLKAFKDFQEAMFPYDRLKKMEGFDTLNQVLQKWIKSGAAALTPTILERPGTSAAMKKGAALLQERHLQEKAGLLERM